MHLKIKELLIYAAKCICGTLIAFAVCSALNYKEIGWPLISVILVLSPDGEDAVKVALTRIKTNAIGAASGLLCLLISATNAWVLCLGYFLSLSGTYLLKLESGARTALAATTIIMLHESGKHYWDVALQRVIAVFAGCLISLLITYLFHFKSGYRLKDKFN